MSSNRWFFQFSFCPNGTLSHSDTFSDGYLSVTSDNLHPQLRHVTLGSRELFIVGNPIHDGKREDIAVVDAFHQSKGIADFAASLNGSFFIVVYDTDQKSFTCINDRFASIATYYTAYEGLLHISSSLSRVGKSCNTWKFNENSIYELLFLRRLLGEKTLLSGVQYLRSASILQCQHDVTAVVSTYWQPDYTQSSIPDRDVAPLIASTLQNAVKAYQSDGLRYGMLLSGGLDSRALIAARAAPFHCFTTCLQENNESRVAQNVAQTADLPFTFIPRPENLLNDYLADAAFLTGGHQIYSECQFMGYGTKIFPPVDSLFIGLGLDIFLGGLYLPQTLQMILGRPAIHNKLLPLSDDLPSMFLDKVSYRLKQSDPKTLIRGDKKTDIVEALRDSIGSIMQRGRDLGATGYDVWEYVHLHNLSRHYSFPMMHSVRTFVDCRAPALENEVFDLVFRMSAQQKLNGTAYQKAIQMLDPSLMEIKNANTNLPAHMSLRSQTYRKLMYYARHKLTGMPYPQSPARADRSWPSAKQHLGACTDLVVQSKRLADSDYLSSLSFLDMDCVRACLDDHENDRHDHAVMINLLLTLEAAMTQYDKD